MLFFCVFFGEDGEGMSVSNRFEYIQRGVGKISLNVDMLYLFNHFSWSSLISKGMRHMLKQKAKCLYIF